MPVCNNPAWNKPDLWSSMSSFFYLFIFLGIMTKRSDYVWDERSRLLGVFHRSGTLSIHSLSLRLIFNLYSLIDIYKHHCICLALTHLSAWLMIRCAHTHTHTWLTLAAFNTVLKTESFHNTCGCEVGLRPSPRRRTHSASCVRYGKDVRMQMYSAIPIINLMTFSQEHFSIKLRIYSSVASKKNN